MKTESRLRVTRPDAIKLAALADNLARLPSDLAEQADLLREVIDLAQIVTSDSIPPEVVTLDSEVLFEDAASGKTARITLVLPDAFDSAAGRISVVSPMGRSLLGREVGDEVEVSVPRGEVRRVRVLAIPYQPEAHGARRKQ
ncbi:MAG: nucleoside diphosphate kinase regulator [Betaproteobacteria bacterium]|nr:MAG: nucleoside diphosphate kinase regulator [Betaproteobacteria bacterium]